MGLREELRDLLDQAASTWPTAATLRDHFAPRARSIRLAGPDLEMPSWAHSVGGSGDVFVELEGDLAGVRLYDDPRGWGAYAVFSVARGSLADVEPVLGALAAVPRAPDSAGRAETVAAYPEIGGRAVRVFVEHDAGTVKQVTVHFET